MKVLSVCSGIEAASVAWRPLGWESVAFSEVDAFPSAVLRHYYPDVPNWGDMTRFKEWPDADIDLLVGGTPCQSFSVAGLRAGLDDPRGSLMLVYLAIARRYRPRWLVWENVPGVLSADDGRAFGSLLGGLAELGYGFAYRVLDAQYFGLAQRRKRVFVVGHLGDWHRAAAVLFERASLSGHPAPRREAGQDAAGCVTARAGRNGGGANDEVDSSRLIACGGNNTSGSIDVATALPFTLAIRGRGDSYDLEYRQDGTANAILTPNGGRAGIGVGAVAFDTTQITSKANSNYADAAQAGPVEALRAMRHQAGEGMQVRRLTPVECEFLQGFPRNYTLIDYRGKPAADGPRYKALGNSMAVPCMYWIGRRIQMVEEIVGGDVASGPDWSGLCGEDKPKSRVGAVKPLAIDLFCGLGGWTEGLLAAGYRVVGFDIERHVYGEHRYPAQLVLQDVLTLHGRQFKDAALIVASPPCQAYSYRAMPWSRAKALPPPDNTLFDACFRIQREACEAAGRHIPLVVENVRGAQKWVGRAKAHFGSFYLWGDVPALMPIAKARAKVSTIGSGQASHATIANAGEGRKQAGSGATWWRGEIGSKGSKSKARKFASAQIAKIPLVLSRHIAEVYQP